MAKKRSASSSRWLAEHEADPYVKAAREAGWRSRAVFKLEEIDQKERLIRPGQCVVDLGAAPGGWCQYVVKKQQGSGRVLGLDLQEIEPLQGVELLQGDFREESILHALEQALGGERQVDLVLSDMAPNMRGVSAADQPASMYLAELALDFAAQQLKAGGDFLTKVFQGEGFDAYLAEMRNRFAKVSIKKPKASRGRSREVYLLARGHRLV